MRTLSCVSASVCEQEVRTLSCVSVSVRVSGVSEWRTTGGWQQAQPCLPIRRRNHKKDNGSLHSAASAANYLSDRFGRGCAPTTIERTDFVNVCFLYRFELRYQPIRLSSLFFFFPSTNQVVRLSSRISNPAYQIINSFHPRVKKPNCTVWCVAWP